MQCHHIGGSGKYMAILDSASAPLTGAAESFDRVARLAAMVLGTPLASVTVTGTQTVSGRTRPGVPGAAAAPSPVEQLLRQHVIDSGDKLVIEDARQDPRTVASGPAGPAGVIAWAGFPVRGPDGYVVGALCVADGLPRRWSAGEVEALETLAHLASDEVALQVALARGAERAALAQTLQESLLPPRLPVIPGLQVAARYVAGGTGAEVLGDFYDVFPSVRGSWGMVVGDVCGKGVPAAKSTALARYTLRAEAHRETRPRLILAALNQALLEWLTDDPRFLTAIYATVRPTLAGASVQISSAGHPLALVHRADGRVQTFGQPGTLLGILPDPDLYDSRALLRAGDSLVLFTDGVTEARGHVNRDIYGEERLRDVIAGLGDMSAARIADAIQQAALAFSGGDSSDDTVALVLKVPRHEKSRPPSAFSQALGQHAGAGRTGASRSSAHRGPGLGEGPPMPFKVLGGVGTIASRGDRGEDRRPARRRVGQVIVEVVYVHPRLMRGRRPVRQVAVKLEDEQRAVADAELDPGLAVPGIGQRVRALGQRVRRFEAEGRGQPLGCGRGLRVIDANG
jgi:serine phosphatase RsbU (regulator of sigma subunit)